VRLALELLVRLALELLVGLRHPGHLAGLRHPGHLVGLRVVSASAVPVSAAYVSAAYASLSSSSSAASSACLRNKQLPFALGIQTGSYFLSLSLSLYIYTYTYMHTRVELYVSSNPRLSTPSLFVMSASALHHALVAAALHPRNLNGGPWARWKALILKI